MSVLRRTGAALVVTSFILGCGGSEEAAQMNPGTVAEGADAAKEGLKGTGNMKNTMTRSKDSAPTGTSK